MALPALTAMEHEIYVLADLLGTFAFALSGAIAAEKRGLDVFGMLVIAHITATGGGIFRDICLGVVPPVGISDWRYLVCSLLASAVVIVARRAVERGKHPVQFFDSFGLGFFAVVGAHKALVHGMNVETAVILGTATAVGGGALRDVLLNRVPVILEREIYAVAALVGASIQVLGQEMHWTVIVTPWFGAAVCFVIRVVSLKKSWSLPKVGPARARGDREPPPGAAGEATPLETRGEEGRDLL